MYQPKSKTKQLVAAALMTFSATGLMAQNKPVTIKTESVPIATVLAQIETQTGYVFEFRDSEIDTERTVSVNADNLSTKDLLKSIFPSSEGVKWNLKGHTITLVSKKKNANKAVAGKRELTGTVMDADGEPLAGAVVKVQGDDKNAVVVDVDGNFFINIDDSDGKKTVLEVSFIGYEPREVPVKGLSHIDIQLAGAAKFTRRTHRGGLRLAETCFGDRRHFDCQR